MAFHFEIKINNKISAIILNQFNRERKMNSLCSNHLIKRDFKQIRINEVYCSIYYTANNLYKTTSEEIYKIELCILHKINDVKIFFD